MLGASNGIAHLADQPTDLDNHRDVADLKATDLRRLRMDVQVDQAALKTRQEDLEKHLLAKPAQGWPEAVEKVHYVLSVVARRNSAEDARHRKLIDAVLADLDRLLLSEPKT
jgi:hypothetical protein